VVEEPPELMAPKPLLSGVVPLDGFLATLHKVSPQTTTPFNCAGRSFCVLCGTILYI